MHFRSAAAMLLPNSQQWPFFLFFFSFLSFFFFSPYDRYRCFLQLARPRSRVTSVCASPRLDAKVATEKKQPSVLAEVVYTVGQANGVDARHTNCTRVSWTLFGKFACAQTEPGNCAVRKSLGRLAQWSERIAMRCDALRAIIARQAAMN